MSSQPPSPTTRRDFLRSTSTVAAAALAAPAILVREQAFAQNADTLRVGLVGCGGRGTGAAGNALTADSNLVITAVGDIFPEPAQGAIRGLKEQFGSRIQVTPDSTFSGLDAYRKVIDSGVDVVLLASPPGFRPFHLRYAVEKGKQIFCEKPMATDGPGIRHVMESVRLAKEKKLNLVAGYCWRYDLPRRAFYEQIHDGTLGDLAAVYGTYLTGPVKALRPGQQKPEGMGDFEFQVRNWMNFTWLSGDGLVEQCIHTVDKVKWAFRDVPPVKCSATGGRIRPLDAGNIFDHVTVVYEWANGARGIVAQRQVPGCHNDNSDYVIGTRGKGWSGWNVPYIKDGESMKWRYKGDKPDMYVVEHQHLYRAIREGKLHNDGDWMATSTLMGIMGRLAAYTGQEVTWEQALNSQQKLVPDQFDWNMKLPVEPLAIPGITKLV
ncbi:MAG: Gfo/Idh/MocA family protein [Verrucomicrobiota bacterium]